MELVKVSKRITISSSSSRTTLDVSKPGRILRSIARRRDSLNKMSTLKQVFFATFTLNVEELPWCASSLCHHGNIGSCEQHCFRMWWQGKELFDWTLPSNRKAKERPSWCFHAACSDVWSAYFVHFCFHMLLCFCCTHFLLQQFSIYVVFTTIYSSHIQKICLNLCKWCMKKLMLRIRQWCKNKAWQAQFAQGRGKTERGRDSQKEVEILRLSDNHYPSC